jgi:hypothetical protein
MATSNPRKLTLVEEVASSCVAARAPVPRASAACTAYSQPFGRWRVHENRSIFSAAVSVEIRRYAYL